MSNENIPKFYSAKTDRVFKTETLIKIANKEGMECGKEQEKINTAKNLINLKVPMDIIIKATGLSKKVINTLL